MNKAENILYIVGRLDCPRTTHCRFIIDDMLKKIKNLHKVEFVLSFETQYDRLKEELVKENLKFMDIECPMIYIEVILKE